MPSAWLDAFSRFALALGFAGAAWIPDDMHTRGHRQGMRVMTAVWSITALYFRPAAPWAHHHRGPSHSPRWCARHGEPPSKPSWVNTALGVSHCGAGCTLGDIIAEPAVFGRGLQIASRAPVARVLRRLRARLILGIAFQHFAIPAQNPGLREGLI